MPVTLALGRWKQEDQEIKIKTLPSCSKFEASLGYMTLGLKKKKNQIP